MKLLVNMIAVVDFGDDPVPSDHDIIDLLTTHLEGESFPAGERTSAVIDQLQSVEVTGRES